MRRLFRSGGKRKGLAALLVLSVFFSPARPAQAESYDPGRLGSICISLTDLGTDREDVLFELYKVGTLKAGSDYQWGLDEALVGTGVDLNSMDTTEKTMEITQTLADAVEDSGLKALSGTTDSEGKAEFTGLTQGKYLLIQPGDDYGIVSPSLVTVPYWEEEWIYDVEVTPKAAAPGEEPGKPTGTTGRPISPNLSTKKNTQDPVRRSSVKTGDENLPAVWAGLLAAAGMVVAMAGRRKMEKRK